MTFHRVNKRPKREERPELEKGKTCHILCLPVDTYPTDERYELVSYISSISLSWYYRDALEDWEGPVTAKEMVTGKHLWFKLFVIAAADFTEELRNAVEAEYGTIKIFEKVV